VLVLEPIFEAYFKPISYGFRPERRPHDAIAEIHHFGTKVWAPETRLTLCDLVIFVDEAAEPVASADAVGVGLVPLWKCA
jgi:hypothetical protein